MQYQNPTNAIATAKAIPTTAIEPGHDVIEFANSIISYLLLIF